MKKILIIIIIILFLPVSVFSEEKSEYVTLDTGKDGMNIRQVIKEIARQTGKQILIDRNVNSTISVKLKNKHFEKALDEIAKLKNLSIRLESKTYIIGPRRFNIGDHGLTRIYRLKYIDQNKMLEIIKRVLDVKSESLCGLNCGSKSFHVGNKKGDNYVLIHDANCDSLYRIQKIVDKYDVPPVMD